MEEMLVGQGIGKGLRAPMPSLGLPLSLNLYMITNWKVLWTPVLLAFYGRLIIQAYLIKSLAIDSSSSPSPLPWGEVGLRVPTSNHIDSPDN